jgi:hypothetical protein
MDVVTLRILTEKSVMGFGQFKDMTVRHVIDLRRGQYLRWCYYNMSGISFNEQVLKEIHIFEKEYIKKPGIDPEQEIKKRDILAKMFLATDGEAAYCAGKNRIKKLRRVDRINKDYSNKIAYYKKSVLQARNRGH